MAKMGYKKLIKADEKHRNKVGSTARKKQKKKTWDICSKYIRLRDALEYCKERGIDIRQFVRVEDLIVKCCTCDKVGSWIYMDAGHFISRGMGGRSGVYFDERNIHTQCKPCNGFGGKAQDYQAFMLVKYGQDIIDRLRFLDKNNSYKGKLIGLEMYYDQEYQRLKKETEK